MEALSRYLIFKTAFKEGRPSNKIKDNRDPEDVSHLQLRSIDDNLENMRYEDFRLFTDLQLPYL